jgi:methanogenic corrinoid protein MtbC1
MVGGAPVTRQYAEQIGADAYSDNAFGAVKLARTLMGNL